MAVALVVGGLALGAWTASVAFAGDHLSEFTGPVTGSVQITYDDPYCPHDAYFPELIEPREHYEGTIDNGESTAQLVVDVCVSSDAGALGGNSFEGAFTLRGVKHTMHGYAAGAQTNLPHEYFFVNLQKGRASGGAVRLVFQGCWGDALPTGLSLIDASVSTVESATYPDCLLHPFG